MKSLSILCLLVLPLLVSCSDTKKEVSQENPVQELEAVDLPVDNLNSSLPYLTIGSDGVLYFSWVEQVNDSTVLKYSRRTDEAWTQPEIIAKGNNWFVNWADYPMIAANTKGQMLAHYLAKSASGTYSYDVNVKHKSEEQWEGPIIPHSDGTPTEHGFVSMIPLENEAFQVAWLDGRNTGGEQHGAMTVRTAVMGSDGDIYDEYELDDRVCDCCQTTGALTDNGPVFIYRDRSEAEVRDMSIVRSVDGEWTNPASVYPDGWEIAACPVNGPRADAFGNTLAVAWYSAPNSMPQVKVIFSTDGGASFEEPIMIDGINPLGRVDLIMLDDSRAMVSWMGREADNIVVKASVVNINGIVESSMKITETSESRGTGFPQMAADSEFIYFAWTQLEGETKVIRSSRLAL